MHVDDMWSLQDGATSHTARGTVKLLNESLPDRVNPRLAIRIVRPDRAI